MGAEMKTANQKQNWRLRSKSSCSHRALHQEEMQGLEQKTPKERDKYLLGRANSDNMVAD